MSLCSDVKAYLDSLPEGPLKTALLAAWALHCAGGGASPNSGGGGNEGHDPDQ